MGNKRSESILKFSIGVFLVWFYSRVFLSSQLKDENTNDESRDSTQ